MVLHILAQDSLYTSASDTTPSCSVPLSHLPIRDDSPTVLPLSAQMSLLQKSWAGSLFQGTLNFCHDTHVFNHSLYRYISGNPLYAKH